MILSFANFRGGPHPPLDPRMTAEFSKLCSNYIEMNGKTELNAILKITVVVFEASLNATKNIYFIKCLRIACQPLTLT